MARGSAGQEYWPDDSNCPCQGIASPGRSVWAVPDLSYGTVENMRVYLSAPHGAERSLLRAVLTELGAEVVTAVDTVGASWQNPIAWEGVDAAVVVLEAVEHTENERVLVDTGIAIGKKLPLLVLAEDDDLSGDFFGIARVVELRGRPNAEALRFHFGLFLNYLQVEGQRDVRPATQARDLDIRPFRARLDRVREESHGTSLVSYKNWAADLFRSAGADIAIPKDPEGRGFDFVAAIPDLDLRSGGPLVVKVDPSSATRELTDTAFNLQFLVLREQAGLGMLVFEDAGLPQSFMIQVVPRVVSIGAGELLRELERETLAQVVIRARDEAVQRL
jgi:hypothetical protein